MDEIKSKEWWQDVSYANAKIILQASIREMTDSFVTAGCYLKLIRDTEGYKEDGYGTIWEFAEAEYGLQRTTASRWMAINDRFSKDGNSPELADQYKDFGKSQLQEMLYLTDDQTAEVTPDMTVKQIREIRRPEPQSEPKVKPLSVLGYPRREYPPGSLIATAGCGSNDCFSCHLAGCEIRGEECYCVEAPCGNPFPCTVLEQTETLKQEIGYSCQFVNPDLAEIRADGMSIPCCRNCETPCAHECGRSGAKRSKGAEADSGADIREDCATSHTVTEQPAEISQDVKDETWFVKEYFKRHGGSYLPELMRICRMKRLMPDRVRAVKNLIGTCGGGCIEFGYCFGSYAQGVSFDADNWTAEIQMTYARFVEEMLKLYDPWDSKWIQRGPEVPVTASEADEPTEPDEDELMCDDCINASCLTGNVDLCANCGPSGRNYEPLPTALEQPNCKLEEGSSERYEAKDMSEVEPAVDEPRFTSAFVRDILWNKERELRDLEECNTDPAGKLPLQLLQSRRAVVAGLRLLLEYTEMREERENEQTDTEG